jgi:hypothetical protein
MNVFIKKARHVKDEHARGLFWRALLPQIRGLKEALVANGACALTHEGRTIHVKMNELTRRSDFKRALKDISAAYVEALTAISGAAMDAGQAEIAVVLAGGGANYPFVQAMAARPRPAKGKVRLRVEPLVPDWARGDGFDERLAPVFPQLSIAIGGAMAPAVFIRQKVGVNSAALAPA